MESISFDRAADYYDRTRSLSAEATQEMTALLAGELEAHRRCLEIGVGTGRIAIPLVEAGIEVAGIDLSEKMLAGLRAKTDRVPAALADATMLPFPAGSFDAAVACHVLHLIPNWRQAVEELARVVRPGGRVLVNLGGWDEGSWRAIEDRFVAEAGIKDPRPGARSAKELDGVMAGLGASMRVLPKIVDNRSLSYGELIDRIESGMYSFTWGVDDATRVRAARAVREWTLSEQGSLEEVREKLWIVSWRAYDLPG